MSGESGRSVCGGEHAVAPPLFFFFEVIEDAPLILELFLPLCSGTSSIWSDDAFVPGASCGYNYRGGGCKGS